MNPSIVAAMDAYMYKVLETMGKRITRVDRSRFTALGDRPFWTAHVHWPMTVEEASKALTGSWRSLDQIVPQYVSTDVEEVRRLMHLYTLTLLINGLEHNLERLDRALQEVNW